MLYWSLECFLSVWSPPLGAIGPQGATKAFNWGYPMSRAYRLYSDPVVQDLLRERKIQHPPVTCFNCVLRVSMNYLQTACPNELAQVFRKKGFWSSQCECCEVLEP